MFKITMQNRTNRSLRRLANGDGTLGTLAEMKEAQKELNKRAAETRRIRQLKSDYAQGVV